MKKLLKTILWVLLIFVVALFIYLFVGKVKPAEKIGWGVTFSKGYAADFEPDWKKMFLLILDDLGVKKIRLVAYWNEIEKTQGKYDFSELDWQVNEVSKRGGEIVLAIGRRLPRWPECFSPEWSKNLPEDKNQELILSYIKETINRYKENKNIKVWQVENEPFLRTFGICPKLDKKFLDKEVALVRYLDPARPVMITESGEFSTWIGGAKRADIIGSSVYRTVYGKLGYVTYPIPPVFYYRKSNLIKLFFGQNKRIISTEIQLEPWGTKPVKQMIKEESDVSLSIEKFNKNVEYARKTGFDEMYLWGVEWWYWRKMNGDDSYWNQARELFK